MSICLAEIHQSEEFENGELRAFARLCPKPERTSWYRACCNDEEVAFVSVGRSQKRLVPHQLFVPRTLRRRGIGTEVLRSLEQIARCEGFESIRVWPRSLGRNFAQTDLEHWYGEMGYTVVPDDTGDMEKWLT